MNNEQEMITTDDLGDQQGSPTERMYELLDREIEKTYGYVTPPGAAGSEFMHAIYAMNLMYALPVRSSPSLAAFTGHDGTSESAALRVDRFYKTLRDELDELYLRKHGKPSIMDRIERFVSRENWELTPAELQLLQRDHEDALVALSDWFADMMVYIVSEGLKFGINVFDVFELVMGSNFSKLGADGNPIYDQNGKFQKGPFYEPPEAAICEYLREYMQMDQQVAQTVAN